jgi:mannose-1-phosphate guanylyltransferase/mannose-1-phosphate guanylyltransferase/mannose-6-phosphate isomerase
MSITPVIMSGGAGSRLWPISDADTPKQFLALTGELTMLQETANRLEGALFDDTLVLLANAAQSKLISDQIGNRPHLVLAEPCRRNTAAAATAAALHIQAHHPEGDDLMLLAPADHVITKPKAFHEAVEMARAAAQAGYIVTFGIQPDSPETGYGYIKRAGAIESGVFHVEAFREKPDLETAQSYCDSGNYDWNSGIFLFSARHFLKEIEQYEPDILLAVKEAYEHSTSQGQVLALEPSAFEKSPSTSIDYAVMERTDRTATVPCSIGWSDLGSYKALQTLRNGLNVSTAPSETKLHEAENCLVLSDGPQVNIIGLDNIGVIIDKGRVLVLDLNKSQDVKHIAEAHKKTR